MARFARPRQLEPPWAGDAIRRTGVTGAVIRTQAPLTGSVNDAASVWAAMWRIQVRIGMVPDAMVIEPFTGLSGKFVVPLAGARHLRRRPAGVTGLARTVRRPPMPAGWGTARLDGIAGMGTQKVSVLRFTSRGRKRLLVTARLLSLERRGLALADRADPFTDVLGRHGQRLRERIPLQGRVQAERKLVHAGLVDAPPSGLPVGEDLAGPR
jgi:hypothetical protein